MFPDSLSVPAPGDQNKEAVPQNDHEKLPEYQTLIWDLTQGYILCISIPNDVYFLAKVNLTSL